MPIRFVSECVKYFNNPLNFLKIFVHLSETHFSLIAVSVCITSTNSFESLSNQKNPKRVTYRQTSQY